MGAEVVDVWVVRGVGHTLSKREKRQNGKGVWSKQHVGAGGGGAGVMGVWVAGVVCKRQGN